MKNKQRTSFCFVNQGYLSGNILRRIILTMRVRLGLGGPNPRHVYRSPNHNLAVATNKKNETLKPRLSSFDGTSRTEKFRIGDIPDKRGAFTGTYDRNA